jgi:4-hydroxy-3-polyprenylbenzoate decarboxylase
MATLTRMGAIIFPPVPAFYHRPKTLDDVINQTATRILDQFDIDVELFRRWDDQGMSRHPDAGKTTTIAVAKERRAAKKQR